MGQTGQAKQQKNPGAVVACIKQLDWMTGLGLTQYLEVVVSADAEEVGAVHEDL